MRILAALLLLFVQGGWIFTDAQTYAPGPQFLDKYIIMDTCLYKTYYQLEMHPDTINRKATQWNDIRLLEIGESCTKCYSYLLFQKDSLTTYLNSKGLDGEIIQQNTLPMETYLLSKKKSTIVTYRTFFYGPVFRYKEKTEDMNWQIINETDTIIGYNCQKAMCQYRGRSYIAWFTMDIPFSTGPYKFHGLPGLILKIADTNDEYIWTCIKFEKAPRNATIKLYKWKYENMNREKMNITLKRMHATPLAYCESLGMKFHAKSSTGKWVGRGVDVPKTYNPIEKQ